MFDLLGNLFDRDKRKRHGGSSGLRGLLERFMGGDHDRRGYRRRYDDDDDYYERDDDRRYYSSSRRRRRHDDDDDD